MTGRRLAAFVDGTPLPEADAVALWDRFSLWMEERRGDLAGFAAKEGFASIHPGVDGDRPVLRASKSASQLPYASVKESAQGGDRAPKGAGGSGARQVGGPDPDRRGSKNPKSRGKAPR